MQNKSDSPIININEMTEDLPLEILERIVEKRKTVIRKALKFEAFNRLDPFRFQDFLIEWTSLGPAIEQKVLLEDRMLRELDERIARGELKKRDGTPIDQRWIETRVNRLLRKGETPISIRQKIGMDFNK